MNNKGFAITTIIFGIMILFCLLLVSLLGILATYKNNMEIIINNEHGARDMITMTPQTTYATLEELKNSSEKNRGLYCFSDHTCAYVSNSELK